MNPLIQLKRATPLFLIVLDFVWLGLLPKAQAVSPAPDGGYPGGNTAEGLSALLSLTTGGYNTAVGFFSLRSDTTNSFNTAIGAGTLLANAADQNTATGAGALLSNTTGGLNTANGALALFNNKTGIGNTAIGDAAGAQITGSGNICIGAVVEGVSGENGVTRIGFAGDSGFTACYINGIYGKTVDPATGIPAFIDGNGKLGTVLSSRRFKHDIKPIDKASEALFALKPVAFQYNSDAKNTPCFGLIAEDVAKVNPDLVIPDGDGKPFTVRYDQVNAMLLNEFLKARRQIDAQQKQIDALTAGLQKVSAQLELSKSAPHVVNNP